MFGKATADSRTSVVVSRAVVVAAPTRFARVCTSPDAFPVCAVGVAAPNPRVFVRAASAAHLRCVSSPRGVRPHTQNGRSFTGTFFSFEQTTWHGQLLGLRFPVSRLCAVVVSVLLERGVFSSLFQQFLEKQSCRLGQPPNNSLIRRILCGTWSRDDSDWLNQTGDETHSANRLFRG